MNLSGVFIKGIAIQILGLALGYLIGFPWGPYVGGFTVFSLIGILLFNALKSFKWTQLLGPTIFWGFAYVALFQLLGYYGSGILPMGLQPFSEEHLIESAFVIFVLASAYVGQLGLLQYITRKLN